MWTKSRSITLSQSLCIAAFLICIGLVISLPYLNNLYLSFIGIDENLMGDKIQIYTLANLYAALIPAFLALVTLFSLLTNMKNGNIFIHKNVSYLRILSYCCFAETVIFFVFSILCNYAITGTSIFGLLLSFASAFFGLILRVIKNVFDAAIEIREENDYTI